MAEKDKESKLKKLKEQYSKIQKKHNLPNFEELNEDFQIEKLSDDETEFFIREVRKAVGDRLANYMRFAETMLNPSNSSMFVFSMIKALDQPSKEKFTEIYKKLSEIELEFIEIDMVFSEAKEASFIREGFKLWQGIKKDTVGVINVVRKSWNSKKDGNNKQYFG